MSTSQIAQIKDAPNGCGYHVHYTDRTGCPSYALATSYQQAERFAAAVASDDNDAMNGRIGKFA